MDYVIRETLRHMQDCVGISTQKTLARMKEFEGDGKKAVEVLNTLASLHRIHNLIEDIKTNNSELLK